MDEEVDEMERSRAKPDSVSYPGIRSKSERQLEGIVSFLPDATFAIDKKGRVIAWNRAMESMTGIKANDILGIGDYEYSLPFYGFRRPILIDLVLQPDPNLEADYEAIERDGMSLAGEVFISFFGRNGSYIWAKASPLYDSNGNITGAIESLRDITERKKAEDAIKESESKFKLLFERSADAMFLMDGKKFIDCNNAAVEMMKCSSRDELLGIHPAEISPERQRDGRGSHEKSEEMIKKAFEKGTYKFEWIRRRSNGEEFPVMITLTVIPWKSEGEQILHVTVKDITERKATENALLESRELYRNLVENLNDIILFIDPSGRITYISPVVEQAFGYGPRELIGRSFGEHVYKDDLAGVKEKFEQAITGKRKSYEFRVLDKENRIRYVRASARLSGDPDSVKGLNVTLTDITDHKEAEMELKESEDRYRLLVESSPDGIIIHQNGIVIFANKAAAVLLNAAKPEELVGNPVISFVHPDYIQTVQDRIHSTQYARDEAPLIEEKFLGINGSEIDVEVAAIPSSFKGKPATQVVFRDITKRKKAEGEIVESREFLDKIINSIGDPIFVKDRQHRFILVNDAECKLLDRQSNEILGLTTYDLFPIKEMGDISWERDEIVFGTGEENLNEEKIITASGATRTILVKKTLYTDNGGNQFLVGAVTDITERKRAEDSLKHSESKYRLLYGSLMDAFASVDMDGRIVECNRSYLGMLGYELDEIIGLTYRDLTPDKWHSFEEEIIKKEILPWGYSDIYEKEYMRKDGTIFPVELRAFLLRDETGNPNGIAAIVRDITERKHMEKMLIQERDKAKQLLDIAGVMILALDTEGRVMLINEKGCSILACEREEIVGKDWIQTFIPERMRDEVKAAFKRLLSGELESVGHFENPIITRQGEERLVTWRNSVIRDENGNIVGTLSSGDDITERKEEENALIESEERYRYLSDAMPDLVFIINKDDRVEYVNNVAARYLNLLPQEAIGRPRRELFPPDTSKSQEPNLQRVFENGETIRNSVGKATFCGRDVWIDTQIVPLRKNSNGVTAVLGVSRDITELKRSEEILKNAKEAAEAATMAKSEFLANMSHEIRTPMNAVIGMTGLLLDEDLTTNQKECLETIRRSGESLLSIINNILDFSKIEAGVIDLEYQPFDLHRCVEATLDLVSVDASRKGLITKCEFEGSAPDVILGDPTRLSQILVNLLGNSIKFTETGEISVSVSGKRLEGENYEIHFAVKDTGIGIPKDKMGRLFQSFSQIDSSTTRKYGGTGLGLAISKKLVEMMKGTIWVESEVGSGTTFHFTIKVEKTLREPINLIKLDSKYDARLHGNLDQQLSILLAEDNLVNQMVTQRMLNKLGYRADIASNGIEVLQALERQSYEVIIMDVLMPEMDGLEATREIRRRWSGNGPKIIAMTASVLKGDREMCLAAGMDGYISKPTRLVELKSALESCRNEKDY